MKGKKMKYGKSDVGVFVAGATENDSVEQNFKIIDFAITNGFEIDEQELAYAKDEYAEEKDQLGFGWFEDIGYVTEQALEYLNKNCVERGVVFTFVDTDFVLLDSNYESVVN
jgi:hypothetical protein